MKGEACGGGYTSIELALDVDDTGTPHTAWSCLPEPSQRFARYGVVGRLAVGGMAEIFLARETIGGPSAGVTRHLALKVLRHGRGGPDGSKDEYFETLFLREGRVAMQLSHPNICHSYEFGKWGGHYFIAMEWVEGVSVRSLIERVRRAGTQIPVDVAVYITTQVAAALEHAHQALDAERRPLGLVHCDVSPHNIMLRHDGVVKLLDFGVAKVERAEEHSREGSVKGKFGYMAPEQCQGRALDGRADIFALGVCLFEMLTARRLYQRGSARDTSRAIVEEPAPSVRERRPDVPFVLDGLLRCALSKAPHERFETAGEFMEALASFASAEGLLLSATRARRFVEELYGADVYRGPTLEVDPEILGTLEPVAIHPPELGSERPPPGDTAGRHRPRAHVQSVSRVRLASSAFAHRISTELRHPGPAARWFAVGACAALVLGGWLWFLTHDDPAGRGPVVTPGAPPSVEQAPAAASGDRSDVRAAQAPPARKRGSPEGP